MSPPAAAASGLSGLIIIDAVSVGDHAACFFLCVLADCVFQRAGPFIGVRFVGQPVGSAAASAAMPSCSFLTPGVCVFSLPSSLSPFAFVFLLLLLLFIGFY